MDDDETTCPYPRLTTRPEPRPGGAIACLGVGGGGKTHENLTDDGYRGKLFIAPSYELLESKTAEYGVHGRVHAVALGANHDEIMKMQRYCSVLVWDEISMWCMETVQFALDRYPFHKHIFCGDPKYQLPPIIDTTKGARSVQPCTPAGLQAMGIPIHRFDYSYRIKCEKLRAVCNQLRRCIDEEWSPEQIGDWVMKGMSAIGQVLTWQQCVERFEIEDGILSSTNEALDEYTNALKERAFVRGGARVRRYRVGKNAPLPNGRIVLSQEPPCKQSVEQYASTVHGFQGNACKHTLFIDTQRMWEPTHWYTAFSRAEYLAKVFLVHVPPPPPAQVYANAFFYCIWSPNTPLVYIGHGTTTPEKRMKGHEREFADTKRRKRCSSHEVLQHGAAQMTVLEKFPCASLSEAKARERYWIERTPNCVNKTTPGRSREEYERREERSAPLPPSEPVAFVQPMAPTLVSQAPTAALLEEVTIEHDEEELPEQAMARRLMKKRKGAPTTQRAPPMSLEEMRYWSERM